MTSTDSHLIGTWNVVNNSSIVQIRCCAYICGRVDVLDGLCNFWSNAVTLDQSHGVFALSSPSVDALESDPPRIFLLLGSVEGFQVCSYIASFRTLELGDLILLSN